MAAPSWAGWDVLLHPVVAGVEFDLSLTGPGNEFVALEVKWSLGEGSVHMGELARLASARDSLRWPGRVLGILVTNLRLVGTAAQAAESLGLEVVAQPTSSPDVLAARLSERLEWLELARGPA
jgi:hypothetical protein